MTGQAQRQARQYRQEEKETLGISFPSSFGTILITPWLQALAQLPSKLQLPSLPPFLEPVPLLVLPLALELAVLSSQQLQEPLPEILFQTQMVQELLLSLHI